MINHEEMQQPNYHDNLTPTTGEGSKQGVEGRGAKEATTITKQKKHSKKGRI